MVSWVQRSFAHHFARVGGRKGEGSVRPAWVVSSHQGKGKGTEQHWSKRD